MLNVILNKQNFNNTKNCNKLKLALCWKLIHSSISEIKYIHTARFDFTTFVRKPHSGFHFPWWIFESTGPRIHVGAFTARRNVPARILFRLQFSIGHSIRAQAIIYNYTPRFRKGSPRASRWDSAVFTVFERPLVPTRSPRFCTINGETGVFLAGNTAGKTVRMHTIPVCNVLPFTVCCVNETPRECPLGVARHDDRSYRSAGRSVKDRRKIGMLATLRGIMQRGTCPAGFSTCTVSCNKTAKSRAANVILKFFAPACVSLVEKWSNRGDTLYDGKSRRRRATAPRSKFLVVSPGFAPRVSRWNYPFEFRG